MTWLLKHRLLLQLHNYILFVPIRKKRMHNRTTGQKFITADESEGMSAASEPSHSDQVVQHELESFIQQIKDSRDRDLFRRLSPYFDGKRHVEDIMYSENMERSELMSFLERHRNSLLMFEHDDTAISQLCPYSHLQ